MLNALHRIAARPGHGLDDEEVVSAKARSPPLATGGSALPCRAREPDSPIPPPPPPSPDHFEASPLHSQCAVCGDATLDLTPPLKRLSPRQWIFETPRKSDEEVFSDEASSLSSATGILVSSCRAMEPDSLNPPPPPSPDSLGTAPLALPYAACDEAIPHLSQPRKRSSSEQCIYGVPHKIMARPGSGLSDNEALGQANEVKPSISQRRSALRCPAEEGVKRAAVTGRCAAEAGVKRVTISDDVHSMEAPRWYMKLLSSYDGSGDWRKQGPGSDLHADVLARRNEEAGLREKAKRLLERCENPGERMKEMLQSEGELRAHIKALNEEAAELQREREEWYQKRASWKVRNEAAKDAWERLTRRRCM